jgi:uncharacterized cupin superfamily protein
VWAHRAPPGEPTRHLQLFLLALATCNTLLALAPSTLWLALALVPASIAIAPLYAVLYAVMPTVAPAGTLTEAYALETTGLMCGLALGSALGGLIQSHVGPAAIWLLAGAAMLAGFLLLTARVASLRGPARRPPAEEPTIDAAVADEDAFATSVQELELERLDPQPSHAILAGSPSVSARELCRSVDGRVERGVWEITAGVVRDVEADELFVVVSGRATIEIEGGPTLEVGPGCVAVLPEGARTIWHIHETLRKVYQVTSSG